MLKRKSIIKINSHKLIKIYNNIKLKKRFKLIHGQGRAAARFALTCAHRAVNPDHNQNKKGRAPALL